MGICILLYSRIITLINSKFQEPSFIVADDIMPAAESKFQVPKAKFQTTNMKPLANTKHGLILKNGHC